MPLIISFGTYAYSPAQGGAALQTIGTTNDVLPDLEGERECGDEDTRKRYVMCRRTTLKIFHVLKHNEEICSAAEAPPGAALITRTTWSLKGCSYEYSKPSSTGVARSPK